MKEKKSIQVRYLKAKERLDNDNGICKENKELFNKFFEKQEYKLKRINGLRQLDEGTYKTLYGYALKFKNINKWFENKPLKDITKEDIKRVYDGLEDGEIKNNKGVPFESLAESYYNKIFKSKLFEMVGKVELAREVIEYTKPNNKEVRYITEDDFKKILNNTYKPQHRLLLWLCWDIGENITAILSLKKSDFHKQKNSYTKEYEYRVNLRKDILKRTRKARSEITNYNETVMLLDQYLKDLNDNDELFSFDYANGKKILNRAVERAKAKCIPNGERVTWKDLRSGMSCHLLKIGWSTDEVNARLGHKPSSDEIDKYINFLAIDRSTPKKKVHQFEMEKISEELSQVKKQEKLQAMRNEELQNQMAEVLAAVNDLKTLKAEKERRAKV